LYALERDRTGEATFTAPPALPDRAVWRCDATTFSLAMGEVVLADSEAGQRREVVE
jgi:hypothetical protein